MSQATPNKPANWIDCEEEIREFERGLATLKIIADACGHGAYTETRGLEEALTFVAEHLRGATHRLSVLLDLKEDTGTNRGGA